MLGKNPTSAENESWVCIILGQVSTFEYKLGSWAFKWYQRQTQDE